jgi:fructose transport system ATP-binding protein
MVDAMKEKEKILEMKHITKRFGGLTALDDVHFDLYTNEILALVGDNGAGKSTLIKIISGAIIPDEGEIFLYGNKVEISNPIDAKKLEIETVYQDLALIDTLDITKNIFLGREKSFLFHKRRQAVARKIIDGLDINIPDIREKVRFLSGGQRQSVAIARATTFGKRIIILDEPTAALGVRESKHILEIIGSLKARGLSIIIITHNLEHAFFISDRFFVLRNGKEVGVKKKEETSVDEIVKMITGGVFVK